MLSQLPLWLRTALAAFVAGAVCCLYTLPVTRCAVALGAIDRPGGRHVHTRPVPRMGGLAIALGFFCAAALLCPADRELSGLLGGALIVAAMGAVDDVRQLHPAEKLLGQFAAALLAVENGLQIRVLSGPGAAPLALPEAAAVALTLLWLVGCANAVNLIDGLDGLAAGVSAIAGLSMMAAALLCGEAETAVLLAALVGACLGFLPCNRCPARMFMGDAGSQFLGFTLAAASVRGLFKFHAAMSFFVPLLALSVPLADTAFAVFRRLLRGQSPFLADRSHIHHRLLELGLSQRQAVAVLCGVSAALGLLSLLLAGTSGALRAVCLASALAALLFVRKLLRKRRRNS